MEFFIGLFIFLLIAGIWFKSSSDAKDQKEKEDNERKLNMVKKFINYNVENIRYCKKEKPFVYENYWINPKDADFSTNECFSPWMHNQKCELSIVRKGNGGYVFSSDFPDYLFDGAEHIGLHLDDEYIIKAYDCIEDVYKKNHN